MECSRKKERVGRRKDMNRYCLFGTIWNSLLRTNLICFAASLLAVVSISAGHASERTERFVQDALDKSYAILNGEAQSDEDRLECLEGFLSTVVDVRRTALFTIGAYANRSPPDEIEEFVGSFRRYITATVRKALEEVRDHTLVISGSNDRTADDSVVVVKLSNAQTDSGEGMKVAFRVRSDTNGKLSIVDIQFEGIWLAITGRADYSSFLARNGGNLSELSKFLDRVVLEANMTREIPE